MTTLTGSQIEAARLLTLRQMLKLELKGLSKSRGPTAYSTLKLELKGLGESRGPTAYSTLKMMGWKGTREGVLAQLDAWRDNLLGESK